MRYADCEPLVKEHDLAKIEEAVRRVVSLPSDTQFTAYRVPLEPPEAHLFVATPHPGEIQRKVGAVHGTQARMLLETWDEYEKVRAHYVDSREDKLLRAFLLMANRHHDELTQLRNTTN
mgnify:FL=1